MARGGTITPRHLADGTQAWVLMWRVEGRRVKRTIRGTLRDAETALTAALAARDRGEQRSVSTEHFEAYANRWLEAKRPRLEASTYADYEAHLRLRLNPAFGKLRLRDVTRQRVEAYVAKHHAEYLRGVGAGKTRVQSSPDHFPRRKAVRQRQPVGPKSINNSLIVLRQVTARAVRDGVVAVNPAAAASRDDPLKLPYEAPRMAHLDREQAAAYLAACNSDYRPLAELLLATGLRIGEALALEWGDVDLEAFAITVCRSRKADGSAGGTKTDAARIVHIGPRTAEMLEQHRRASNPLNVLVFASSRGTMLAPSNIRRRWHSPTLEAAKLPLVRLHDLRHTAATLAGGESILFVQAQLGHTSVRTTQRYAHPDHQAHREAAARAEAWRTG